MHTSEGICRFCLVYVGLYLCYKGMVSVLVLTIINEGEGGIRNWSQSSMRPSFCYNMIVKSRSNRILEPTSTKQWGQSCLLIETMAAFNGVETLDWLLTNHVWRLSYNLRCCPYLDAPCSFFVITVLLHRVWQLRPYVKHITNAGRRKITPR